MMQFNLDETSKGWEDGFYENAWEPDTLNLTPTEEEIVEEMTNFLPRHMPKYDWNLPYAEEMVLIIRRVLAKQSG